MMNDALVNINQSVLMLLWDAHKEVVESVIHAHKYSFIKPHERDDYRQEIFIKVFTGFHKWPKYRSNGMEFKAWLYILARAAVIDYRNRLVLGTGKVFLQGRYKYVENMDILEAVHEEYNEDNLRALDNAVNDLKPDHQKVIQMYYHGVSFLRASLIDGRGSRYYQWEFTKIKQRLRAIKDNYWQDMRIGDDITNKEYHGLKGDDWVKYRNNFQSKPVLQISYEGKIIKEWASIKEAARGGFDRTNIIECAKGRCQSSNGFIWLYKTDIGQLPTRLKKMSVTKGGKRSEARPVEQLSLDGEVVKWWPSARAAESAGFHNALICRSLKKGGAHNGYRWRYAEASETPTQATA
jgi:RNA polymerase sigma factor (sigma-70 family)